MADGGVQGPVMNGAGVAGGLASLLGGPGFGIGQMLLSPLFGHLFGGGGPDYGNLLKMLQQHFGVNALQGDTQKMYQMGLASPGFQNQLQGINLAGNQFNQNYAAGQAGQGFSGDTARSGTGQVGAAGAPVLSSMHRGQAYGDLYAHSQQLAMQNLMARLQALGGLTPGMGQHDLTRNLFGGGMSAISDWQRLNALGGQSGYQQPHYP